MVEHGFIGQLSQAMIREVRGIDGATEDCIELVSGGDSERVQRIRAVVSVPTGRVKRLVTGKKADPEAVELVWYMEGDRAFLKGSEKVISHLEDKVSRDSQA